MRLTFLGAARTVTGSQYLLELPGLRALVDCGLYQGRDEALRQRLHRFDFDPATLDVVLLTHAHIDHCGLLPRLWKLGFRGKIHATSATTDLCRALLADSAKIQEEDAKWDMRKWRQGQQVTPPPAPLYTLEDAEAVMEHFAPVDYDSEVQVAEGLRARWVDAGHILGAASVEVWARENSLERKIVFSGDVGIAGRPILRDPTLIESADLVIMESTYGNRLHPPEDEVQGKLKMALETAVRGHGHVIIPAFAVGRTQELLYRLDRLEAAGEIPQLPVYVDSPLASRATRVFEEHRECYDAEALRLLAAGDDPLKFPKLRFTASVTESQALNRLTTSAVIISASGMCNAGRIRHHLHHHLEHGNDVILFVGFQAEGTLGRVLVEGTPRVSLFGRSHRVRARIVSIRGLSAHADQKGLLEWAGAMQGVGAYLVSHGEEESTLTLAGLLAQQAPRSRIIAPTLGQSIDLLDEAGLADEHARTAAEVTRLAAAKEAPPPAEEPSES